MNYPHTIENGAGEVLTFEARKRDERGEYLEVSNVCSPGAGPPMHVHHLQEESLTVVAGEIAYEVAGEEPQTAGVGETVTFTAGVAHRFWNAGDGDLRCTGYIRPPGNVEFFLGEIFASQRRNDGKRPGGFDSAWLLTRYRSEFDLLEIPTPVKRVILPLIAAGGSLFGLDGRFDPAPEPMTAAPSPA